MSTLNREQELGPIVSTVLTISEHGSHNISEHGAHNK